MMRKTHQVISSSILTLLIGTAHADIVLIAGDASTSMENTGSSFTGSVDYAFNTGSMGTLTIILTNTTPESVGGYLTGFVFDIATADAGATVALSSATNANFLDTGAETASPFGDFDAGASLNANWAGGGNPSDGIPAIMGMNAGTTETYVFDITASDAAALSAFSFLGDNGDWFAVRFRGLNDGGSDKLLITVIPLPNAALAGIGMLGLGLGVRTIRRRR